MADKGAFEIDDPSDLDDYNLRPSDNVVIPEDQATLQARVYETRGAVKFLVEQKVLTEKGKKEFAERIQQVAIIGLMGDTAQVGLASKAIEQIRGEILLRHGKRVIYRYLVRLGGFGAAGVALGLLTELAGFFWDDLLGALRGYGFVVAGAMLGAWISAAANRRDVTLEQLSDFLGCNREPAVRMAFVALLATAVGILIANGVLSVSLGTLNLGDAVAGTPNPRAALLLGLVGGIAERALSVRLLARAQEVVAK